MAIIIPDIGGTFKASKQTTDSLYREALIVSNLFPQQGGVSDVFERVGYSPRLHREAARQVPLDAARLGAVNYMLDAGDIPVGPNASRKDIERVYAALETAKKELEHSVALGLKELSPENAQYTLEDVRKALRAMAAENAERVVPPNLLAAYREKLDAFKECILDGDDSGFLGNEAAQVNVNLKSGSAFLLLAAGIAYAAYQIFGGAASYAPSANEVQHSGDKTPDQNLATPIPTDTPARNAPAAALPAWLKEKKGITGGKYYEVDREKLPVEGVVGGANWKIAYYEKQGKKWVDTDKPNIFAGDELDPLNGKPNMAGGVKDGKYIIIVDEEVFKAFNNDVGIIFAADSDKQAPLPKGLFKEAAPGIYYFEMQADGKNVPGIKGDVSGENLVGIRAAYPTSTEKQIEEDNGWGPIGFRFKK